MTKKSWNYGLATVLFTFFSWGAAADGTYLLQLGSFESQAEAQARWSQLQQKYPQLLEGLSVRLMDVTLPPDNFTVYRTQAGALSSRSDAQIICDRLSAQGDECYVVETAMFEPQTAPVAVPAAAVTAPAPQIEAPVTASAADTNVAAAKPEAATPVSEPAVQPMPKKRSFWSALNPFSGDEDEAVQPAPAKPDVIEYEGQSAAEMNKAMDAADANMASVAPATTAPEPLMVSAPVAAPVAPVGQHMLPDIDKPGTLAAAPAAAPAPAASQPVAAASAVALPPHVPFQVKHNGQLLSGAPVSASAQADVKVDEAVRVPVSGNQTSGAFSRIMPVQALRDLGMPSQTLHEKNLWAQISYFPTQQDALIFWDGFRTANPDFPPVRVRIVNPYMAAVSTAPRVSLRIGPFEDNQMVQSICGAVTDHEMFCRGVTDIGASSSARWQRTDGREESRMKRMQSAWGTVSPMYWVQLGGFASSSEAHAQWNMIQQRHAPALDGTSPNIVAPMMSSGMTSVYRLRTGPFPMRPAADAMCSSLKQRGTRCITVFSR